MNQISFFLFGFLGDTVYQLTGEWGEVRYGFINEYDKLILKSSRIFALPDCHQKFSKIIPLGISREKNGLHFLGFLEAPDYKIITIPIAHTVKGRKIKAEYAVGDLLHKVSYFKVSDVNTHKKLLQTRGWASTQRSSGVHEEWLYIGKLWNDREIVIKKEEGLTSVMLVGSPLQYESLAVPSFQDIVFYRNRIYGLSVDTDRHYIISRIFVYDGEHHTQLHHIMWDLCIRDARAVVKREVRFSVDTNILIEYNESYIVIFPNPMDL